MYIEIKLHIFQIILKRDERMELGEEKRGGKKKKAIQKRKVKWKIEIQVPGHLVAKQLVGVSRDKRKQQEKSQ